MNGASQQKINQGTGAGNKNIKQQILNNQYGNIKFPKA
jgi:hypothetical protein